MQRACEFWSNDDVGLYVYPDWFARRFGDLGFGQQCLRLPLPCINQVINVRQLGQFNNAA